MNTKAKCPSIEKLSSYMDGETSLTRDELANLKSCGSVKKNIQIITEIKKANLDSAGEISNDIVERIRNRFFKQISTIQFETNEIVELDTVEYKDVAGGVKNEIYEINKNNKK